MMAKVFHIHAPMPRKGSVNEFYAANASRVIKTICGAERTRYDVKFLWSAVAVGDYVPCERCIEVANEVKARRKAVRNAKSI